LVGCVKIQLSRELLDDKRLRNGEKMRIAKWDNLKFGLIYCVVLGHMIGLLKTDSQVLRGIQLFIYTFHMPAFLFISGLFSKRTIDERKYHKVIPYFVLYLFMKLFRLVVHFLMTGKISSFHFFTESGVPWFALTLFLCYLLTMAVSRYNRVYILILAVCVGILAGYDTELGDFLTGMRLFTLYPFFLIGYCIPVDKLTAFTNRKLVKLLSALTLVATLFICLLFEERFYGKLNFFKGKTTYKNLDMLQNGGLYRGIYYILAFALVICVIAVVPSVQCMFSRWGRRTLQVFALHYPILTLLLDGFHLKSRLAAIWPNGYLYVMPGIALVVTVVLSAGILEPFFNRLIHPAMNTIGNTEEVNKNGIL
jgi:fucose 4-O-acetylase-like acetyltransferase